MINVKQLIERVERGRNATRLLEETLYPYGTKVIENDHIRAMVGFGDLHIYHLEHAGKRGIKGYPVETVSLQWSEHYVNKAVEQNIRKLINALPKLNYQQVVKWMTVIVNDAKARSKVPDEKGNFKLYMNFGHERALRVAPAGSGGEVQLSGKDYYLTASYNELKYGENNSRFQYIGEAGRAPTKLAKFYSYVKQNKKYLESINYSEFEKIIKKFAIPTHTYYLDHD